MKDDKFRSQRSPDLRKRAGRVMDIEDGRVTDMSSEEMRGMLHDLRTHQIELEMQNEKLRKVQVELLESRDRYTDLFDFAPVGYLTLNDNCLILEANLTIAEMLRQERSLLVNRHLSEFIVDEDLDIYNNLRRQLLDFKKRQTCELRLQNTEGDRFWVKIECVRTGNGEGGSIQFRTVINDITERKCAEDEVKRLARFPSENPNPVLRIDSKGNILYANAASTGLLDVWDRRVSDTVPPDIRSSVVSVFSSRQNKEIEVVCGEKVLLLTLSPVTDSDYANVYGQDITQRKLITETLQASEEKFHSLFENANDAIFIIDTETQRFLEANEKSAKLLGYSREELLKLSVHDISAPVVKGSVEKIVRELKEKGGLVFEHVQQCKDGTTIPVEISSKIIEYGGRQVLQSFVRDISDRKQVENALAESEEQYRLLFNEMISGAALCEVVYDGRGNPCDYRFLQVNPAFEKLTGLNAKRIIGKTLMEVLPGTERRWFEIFEKVIIKGTPAQFEDYSKELDRYYQGIAYCPQKHRLAVVFNDITGRKQAEEEARKSVKKTKMFAFSVAHDLKNPAIVIHGLAKLFHRRYQYKLGEQGESLCKQILRSSELIVALVDKINLFISTSETPLVLEKIDIKEIIQIVREEFSTQIHIRGLKWTVPEYIPPIWADRISMVRLFRNLVDNALKYGGDNLSEITLGYQESDSLHILFVQDDGKGVRIENAPDLFQLFKRETTDHEIKGTGLGLAIVREIVEQHRGKVWVEPGPKKGVIFYIAISKYL